MNLRKFLLPAAAALLALAYAPTAQAAFEIRINTSGGTVSTVVDETGFDQALGDTSLINARIDLVNAELADFGFEIGSLKLSSNAPSNGNPAFLNLTGSVTRLAEGGDDGFIEIVGFDNRYSIDPAIGTLSTSGGGNLTNAVGTTGVQTFYNYTDGLSVDVESQLFTAATNPDSYEDPFKATPLGSIDGTFSLIAGFRVANLVRGGTAGFDVSTVVGTAVPEPASIAMMLIGGAGLSIRTLRRRKASV